VGEPDENYRFGLLRANGIRDILLKKGVPAAQIKCKSMGDKKPVATNDTPYGRYQNRRVELLIAP
ncbi:MAG: OmpA family protein, partial [Saprospiraceae bacterium]|nr:OmpA family protein [Saprospiraceae bacterium]